MLHRLFSPVPVGFVTFESREQAEEAMTKLQGVKFDPDGNQHMRLEFARSNTKVTKPKTTMPVNFHNMNAINSHHNAMSQHNSLVASLGSCQGNLISPGNLTGMVANLQPSIFAQLAAAGSASKLLLLLFFSEDSDILLKCGNLSVYVNSNRNFQTLHQ
ncbi:unnamed protein product [Trichobilharzia regenti]|nr:unnamed protein product [Trichobilharzia regenti]